MRTILWGHRILLGSVCTGLLVVASGQAEPPAAVTQILSIPMVQKGVDVAMPTPDEQAKCTVVGDPNLKPGQTAWVLKDGKGTILRRFIDTNGDKYPDLFSYYKDGLEVYREVDTKFAGKPDKFIWLNTGGSKIGISKAGNGTIDAWQAISLEEMSQEVMHAVANKDWNRFAPLLINDDDLSTIGVAAAEAQRIKKNLANAASKFNQVAGKFNLNANSKWLHVETGNPSRMLAESTGWKQDVIIHARAMILCDTAGKTEYIQLADIVKVGETWKLLDAPTTIDTPAVAGNGLIGDGANPATVPEDGPLQKTLKELADHDAKAPQDAGNGQNAAMVGYHRKRAEIINKIVALCPENQRENWYKQIIDSLAATVSASKPGEAATLQSFRNYADQIAKGAPGSEVASYAQYRLLIVENNQKLPDAKTAKDLLAIQADFADRLKNYVNTYPNGSDAAEAMHRLGELHEEPLNKEAEARKWYETTAQRFPNSKQAAKATGAVRRLASLGQRWDVGVNADSLDGQPWNPAQLAGRIVVVYYWATWVDSAAADFTKMKEILQPLQSKGLVTLVAVNVDDKAADARAFLLKNAQEMPQGIHIHSPGSFESPAVIHYGLNVFPAMFLQDNTGKITSRTLDVGTLDEELKKIVK